MVPDSDSLLNEPRASSPSLTVLCRVPLSLNAPGAILRQESGLCRRRLCCGGATTSWWPRGVMRRRSTRMSSCLEYTSVWQPIDLSLPNLNLIT